MNSLYSLVLLIAGQDPVAAADALFAKRFPCDKPGAAVVVIRDGRVALCKGYGLADMEKKIAVTPKTRFDLASVSKQFTAMAVLILAERGRLRLDDDVRKYVPGLPETDAKRPIRLEDLLRHTSGLPDYLNVWKGDDAAFAKLTNDDIAGVVAARKLDFPTGTKHRYSNTNYALLPVVVAKASGKPFAQFVKDEIFTPAGMTDSVVFDAMSVVVPDRAEGYATPLFGARAKSRRDGPVCGDGNVFTTVEDLAKWDAALRDNRLIKAELLQRAFTAGRTDDGKEFGYGYGWGVAKDRVEHSGGWAGTATYIGRWLDPPLTIAVLCNDESADPRSAARDAAKLFRRNKK